MASTPESKKRGFAAVETPWAPKKPRRAEAEHAILTKFLVGYLRFMKLFRMYARHFDKIHGIFMRSSILNESYDQFYENMKEILSRSDTSGEFCFVDKNGDPIPLMFD